MYPNKVDKGKGKAVSPSQDLSPQEGQEGMLSLEELAAFGVSAEDYEQDRQARQSLALRKAPTRIQPAFSSPSKGCPPAQSNLGISEEDIEEDQQAAKDLASLKKATEALTSLQNKPAPAHAPPLPPQADPSAKSNTFSNAPGILSALDKHISNSATKRVRVDKDPFDLLESLAKETQGKCRKFTMPPIPEQLEDIEEGGELNLRQQALGDSEQDVPPRENLPPAYEEGPMVLYQVILRPLAQPPVESPYAYSQLRHVIDPAKDNPKYATLEFVKAGMSNLPVNWELVQGLDNNDGFCFALESFREAPFQSRGWQDMVEVRRFNNENETWETISPFEESQLHKEVMARYRGRQKSSNTEVEDVTLSPIATGEEELGVDNVIHGAASLLDGAEDIKTDDSQQTVKTSVEEADPDSS